VLSAHCSLLASPASLPSPRVPPAAPGMAAADGSASAAAAPLLLAQEDGRARRGGATSAQTLGNVVVSIVGTGVLSAPDYAPRMFRTLFEQGINIEPHVGQLEADVGIQGPPRHLLEKLLVQSGALPCLLSVANVLAKIVHRHGHTRDIQTLRYPQRILKLSTGDKTTRNMLSQRRLFSHPSQGTVFGKRNEEGSQQETAAKAASGGLPVRTSTERCITNRSVRTVTAKGVEPRA